MRSAIANALWVSIRHLVVWLFVWWCSVPGWYHAGSLSFSRGESRITEKVRLYFFAIFNILSVPLLRIIVRVPLVWGFQVCMKTFILAFWFVPFGAAVSMITSVIFAHVSLFTEGLRYVLSHIISMASFLEMRSRRLRLPSSTGR